MLQIETKPTLSPTRIEMYMFALAFSHSYWILLSIEAFSILSRKEYFFHTLFGIAETIFCLRMQHFTLKWMTVEKWRAGSTDQVPFINICCVPADVWQCTRFITLLLLTSEFKTFFFSILLVTINEINSISVLAIRISYEYWNTDPSLPTLKWYWEKKKHTQRSPSTMPPKDYTSRQ